MMRVLHAPFFDGNQYQEELTSTLENENVESEFETVGTPFAPFLHHLIFEEIDVLHLHWLHPYFLFGSKRRLYRLPFSKLFCAAAALVFLCQVALARRVCDRVVWTAHNRCNHERRYPELDRWVTRYVATRVDAVQVWDERTQEELCEYLGVVPKEIHIIPHGNYCERYEREAQTEAREKLGLSSAERVYLYFGVIRPYKGVPDLIDAFETVETGTLLVAGNPKYADLASKIRTSARGRDDVRLDLKYVSEENVGTYFSAADIVVLPYRHIFNSGTVLLSMSMERAVVAPSLGSIPSVLPEGNILYDDLQRGLERARGLSDEKLRETGRTNLEVARTDHDWEPIARRTISMYTS